MLGGHVHKYEAVLWTMEKLKKKTTIFLLQNQGSIFHCESWNFQETCILVILKGFASSKVEKVPKKIIINVTNL